MGNIIVNLIIMNLKNHICGVKIIIFVKLNEVVQFSNTFLEDLIIILPIWKY